MTLEEAIKTIQVAIAEVEWNYPLDYAIAFETAIKALEKQVEKNHRNEYTDNLDITTQIPVCPLCGNYDIDETDEYCYECGQKIDWGETK